VSAPAVTYHVEAFNTATASANKIHDDAVARRFGFRGGLVPGVDVYAYLTRAPVQRWGLEWLRRGGIEARFVQPVYDGDRVSISAQDVNEHELDMELTDPTGARCATARARLHPDAIDRPLPPAAPLPDPRPAASAESLRPGSILGSLRERFDPDQALSYLADVRETLAIYQDGAGGPLAHPGWLLRFANSILARNVVLGPWIHVASDVRLLGVVGPQQLVEARGAVLDEFERQGHRFVTLDVALLADGELVQRVTHTAIHTPRRR
jgi:acyl dehydratase